MFDDNTETKEEERWQAATAAPQNMASFLIERNPPVTWAAFFTSSSLGFQ